MSVDATRWAWRVKVTSSTKRLVLLALADRAGEDHTCFPSAIRMTKDTNLNRKTVLAAITDLMLDGLIVDTGERKGRGTRVLKLIGVESREDEINTQKTTDPKNGTSTEIGMSTDPKNGTSTSPNIGIQNLKGNLKLNLTEKTVMGRALKDKNADPKLIEDWLIVRKKKKAADSERAVSMFFKQVEASGQNLNAILNLCVIKEWKGFESYYLKNINISDYLIEQKNELADPVLKQEPPINFVKTKRSYI